MSTAPSPESVEQTKQQIRGLINEIAEMSRNELPADDYFPAVLKRVVDALAAIGGAIWLVDEAGQLRLSYHISYSNNLMDAENEDATKHARLLARLISRGQSELVPPYSMLGQDQQEGNPTPYLLVVAPLSTGKQSSGIIEVLQRPDSAPNIQKGYQRFLEQMAGLVGEWLKGHNFQRVTDRQQMWQQADHFARLAHDNLDRRDTAFTIANEGRQLIGCDRVSVAIKRGRKCKIEAISGQDTIENRSNIVTALNTLATRVVVAGEALWYDGSTEDLPPQLEEAVEDYVDLSHGRSIVVLPVRRPEKLVAADVHSKQAVIREDISKNEIIGALIIEQIESQVPQETLKARCDLVYEHAARALNNSLTHSDLFLMPLWRSLSRATWFFRGSALPKTLAVIGLASLVLLGLFFIQIEFTLKADGVLKPKYERQVFAHENGEVELVEVDHGAAVTEGQLLVKLRNRELDLEYKRVKGELDSAISQLASYNRLSTDPKITSTEKANSAAQAAEYQIRRQSLEDQLRLLEERRSQLERVSPINGIVMDWKLKEKLRARPVVVGQVLVNVADTSREWHLELSMPEKRMKHLDEAFKSSNKQPLEVEYLLTSDSATYLSGKLHANTIQARAQLDSENGPIVKMIVEPDSMQNMSGRTNTSVTAKVKCGKRAAAFVFFHEVVEWFQAKVLFRFF